MGIWDSLARAGADMYRAGTDYLYGKKPDTQAETKEEKEKGEFKMEHASYVIPKKRAKTVDAKTKGEKAVATAELEGLKETCDDTAIEAQIDQNFALYGVGDGISGAKDSYLASQTLRDVAIETAQQYRQGNLDEVIAEGLVDRGREDTPSARREEMLRTGVEFAQQRLLDTKREKAAQGEEFDPATTVSIFAIEHMPNGRVEASYANAGDSATYRYNAKDRSLIQLTRDNSVVEMLTDYQLMDPEIARAINQSEQMGSDVQTGYGMDEFLEALEELKEREKDPYLGGQLDNMFAIAQGNYAKLAQALKREPTVGEVMFTLRNIVTAQMSPDIPVRLETGTTEVEDGDLMFSLSDGIRDVLTDARIEKIITVGLEEGKSMQEIFTVMSEEAKNYKGPRDKGGDDISISGALVRVPERAREERGEVAPNAKKEIEIEIPTADDVREWKYKVSEYEDALRNIELATQDIERLPNEGVEISMGGMKPTAEMQRLTAEIRHWKKEAEKYKSSAEQAKIDILMAKSLNPELIVADSEKGDTVPIDYGQGDVVESRIVRRMPDGRFLAEPKPGVVEYVHAKFKVEEVQEAFRLAAQKLENERTARDERALKKARAEAVGVAK